MLEFSPFLSLNSVQLPVLKKSKTTMVTLEKAIKNHDANNTFLNFLNGAFSVWNPLPI